MKKNYKPIVFTLLLVGLCFVIGGTIAYYTSSDTFNNEFDTGTYKIETQEAFVSPDNWTPGTTTPKTVIATNKGSTDAVVRIKLTPSWVDANGDPLDLVDSHDNEAAIINFSNTLSSHWIYDDGYYYYKKALQPNDSSPTLIDSVTFNPEVEFGSTKNCETVNGVTTCTTEINDYAGGKYTLEVVVETAQFDKYKEIWNTDVEIIYEGVLVKDNTNSNTFGKNINKSNFESVTFVDNLNVPNDAIDSWDASVEQNSTIMAWYVDTDSDGKYELFVGQEDGVKANSDSSSAFLGFSYVENMDLSKLDVSKVKNMDYMFYSFGSYVENVNIDLSGWDTSNVESMADMFYITGRNSTTVNIDLSGWDVSKVKSMRELFSYTGYSATTVNINIDGWDTSNVEDMSKMFNYTGYNATTLNLDLSDLNTSSVTNMDNMFNSMAHNVATLDLDLSHFNTSNVTSMNSMFSGIGYYSSTFNLNLSNWDTSNVTDMDSMFRYTGNNSTTFNITGLNGWNVSSVVDMSKMFSQTGKSATTWSIGNLSGWRPSSAEEMDWMFDSAGNSATSWTIGDLSNWDTSNVKTMESMFFNVSPKSTSFNLGNIGLWDTSKVEAMNQMFYYAGYYSTTWNIGNLSGWDTSNVTTMQAMFSNAGNKATTWSIGDLSGWDTSQVTNMNGMFTYAGQNSTTWNSIGTLKVYATNISAMFSNCPNAKGTLSIFSNPTTYSSAFYNAATKTSSGITVNYNSSTTNIDSIIATKTYNSNITKGVQLD